MRIRTFSKFIDFENLRPHTLTNSTVVFDGHKYFYSLYAASGLQFVFGCESDKYAQFLRQRLSEFQRANVTCYFIFKGGHENLQKRIDTNKTGHLDGRDFAFGREHPDINKDIITTFYPWFYYVCLPDIVLPIFMKDVYKEVLDEMGFNYTVCEFEPKTEIVAFAQKNKCSIVSFDIEYCFSGVPYIPYSSIKFDDRTNTMKCGLFTLDNFLIKHRLTEDKFAVFAALTDEKNFPENHFKCFLRTLNTPLGYYKRHAHLIRWLSQKPKEQAIETIFRYISAEDQVKFKEVEKKVRDMIRRPETPGVATAYLENGNKIDVIEKDPEWFQKGVAAKHIAVPLINISRSHIVIGSWVVADFKQDDAMLLSMDIIKYMYNLLTNFENDEVTFITSDNQVIPVTVAGSRKPDYEAVDSPFENGWTRLEPGLFDHFLTETLRSVNLGYLEKLPEDLRLLMIALIYFSRKKCGDVASEVFAVLLSYVALSALRVSDEDAAASDTSKAKTNFLDKPILDPTTDPERMSDADKLVAKELLKKYFRNAEMEEAKNIFDEKLLHPLVQFQYCLFHFNNLNRLCGLPYKPVVYSRVYNASGVYRLTRLLRSMSEGEEVKFLQKTLGPAPTVLAFVQGLIQTYEELMYL